MQVKSALNLAKFIMENGEYEVTLDATVGNGYDTKILSERSKKVYAFDLQEEAIMSTKEKNDFKNVIFIHDNHKNIATYIPEKLDLVVFNLGYLPGGDKSIVTQVESTLCAVKSAMDLLKNGAKILITSYSGHLGGEEEQAELIKFINTVDSKIYYTFLFTHVNGKNSPAKLIIIEKKMQV